MTQKPLEGHFVPHIYPGSEDELHVRERQLSRPAKARLLRALLLPRLAPHLPHHHRLLLPDTPAPTFYKALCLGSLHLQSPPSFLEHTELVDCAESIVAVASSAVGELRATGSSRGAGKVGFTRRGRVGGRGFDIARRAPALRERRSAEVSLVRERAKTMDGYHGSPAS
jgi:hypothetical protein